METGVPENGTTEIAVVIVRMIVVDVKPSGIKVANVRAQARADPLNLPDSIKPPRPES